MALTCARCGAQNPDGNQFCQACGTPLTAVAAGPPAAPPAWGAPPPPPAAAGPPAAPPAWGAPPPPPAAAGPPAAPPAWSVVPQGPPTATAPPLAYASPPPVAYASPYYSPAAAAPQAPVHRTPWVLIIAAVVGLVVIMAGCGTAVALLGNKANNSAAITGDVPSPSPAGSPSPVASPTAPQGPTAENNGETVPVPTGWVVVAKDNETITLADPAGLAALAVASAPQSPTMTAQQQKSGLDAALTGKYPDTKPCGNSRTTTGSLGGVQGLFWQLCFTIVSNGQSLPAEANLFVGTNSDGSVFYGVILLTAQTYMQNFVSESAPILKGIVWKLK